MVTIHIYDCYKALEQVHIITWHNHNDLFYFSLEYDVKNNRKALTRTTKSRSLSI